MIRQCLNEDEGNRLQDQKNFLKDAWSLPTQGSISNNSSYWRDTAKTVHYAVANGTLRNRYREPQQKMA
ncbi:MAG: hypothetical protein AAGD25_24385 [Cyanobacteria bacterium P01_F01_bin.150]